MKKIISFFRDGKAEELLGCIAIVVVIVPVIINIINRSFLNKYSLTLETMALFAYVWIGYGFFGYLYKKDTHVDVKFVVNMLPPAGQYIFELIRDLFIFGFTAYMTYWGFKLCKMNVNRTVAGTSVSLLYAYLSIAVGYFSGALRSGWALVSRFFKKAKKEETEA